MNTSGTSTRRSTRLVELLAQLNNRGETALSDLARELKASEATIRRDVAMLAEQGLLVRTHGGARPVSGLTELPVQLRGGRNRLAKQRIARRAAEEIPRGRHAMALTGGTTAVEVLRALHHRHDLTIITNSITIALEAANQGQSRVLIAGGVLRTSSMELVGSLTENTFKHINVATAIVGTDGISVGGGVTTHDDIEARTNHTMIERAQRVIVVADSSKVGRVTLAKLATLSEVDLLITDDGADPDEVARIRRSGVQVEMVPAT